MGEACRGGWEGFFVACTHQSPAEKTSATTPPRRTSSRSTLSQGMTICSTVEEFGPVVKIELYREIPDSVDRFFNKLLILKAAGLSPDKSAGRYLALFPQVGVCRRQPGSEPFGLGKSRGLWGLGHAAETDWSEAQGGRSNSL